MEIFLLSHSRKMSLKADLLGDVIYEHDTGLKYMLQPSEDDLKRGIIQYIPEVHDGQWKYLTYEGLTYAINCAYID